MKKWIVFVPILLVLIAIAFIVIGISNQDNGIDRAGDNLNNDKTTGEVVKNDSGIRSISGNIVEGGGSEGGSSGSSSSGESSENLEDNIEEDKELPSDLKTKPCGFYFLDYNVCAGVCPDGQCLIDGKSCYCRIV